MRNFGEILKNRRKAKRISLKKAASDIHIKPEQILALETQDWQNLPEPPFVKGFITSYAKYLGLNPNEILPLYRREYDEKRFEKSETPSRGRKRFYLTPAKLLNIAFAAAIVAFIAYLSIQYSSIFSAPSLEVTSPSDDETVTVPAIIIEGKVEKDATVSIDGEFVPIDSSGNFTYQYNLKEGQNIIEIIGAKRLSPKTKIERIVRLVR